MTTTGGPAGPLVGGRLVGGVVLAAIVWAASTAAVLAASAGSLTIAIAVTPALGAAAVIRAGRAAPWILAGGVVGELAVLAAFPGSDWTSAIGGAGADLAAGVLVGLLLRWVQCRLVRPVDPVLVAAAALLVAVPATLLGSRTAGLWGDPRFTGDPFSGSYYGGLLLGAMLVLPVALLWGSAGSRRKEFAAVLLAGGLLAVAGAAADVTALDPWLVAWLVLAVMLAVGVRYDTWCAATLNLVVVAILIMVGQAQGSPDGLLAWQAAMSVSTGLGLVLLLVIERRTSRAAPGPAAAAPADAAAESAIFARSPVPTMRVKPTDGGRLVVAQANLALARILGGSADAIAGRDVSAFVIGEGLATIEALMRAAATPEPRVPGWIPQGEVQLLGRDRSVRQALLTVAALGNGETGEFVIHVEDVTARREAENALTRYSLYDRQTGLLNRKAFVDRLDAALHRLHGDVDEIAIVFLDVDDFKVVNDSMGHRAGDRLLSEIASRIRGVCAPGAAVARMGGDEFAVISEIHGDQEDPGVLAGRLQEAAAKTVDIGGTELTPTVSAGIARTRDPSCDGAELIRQADLALYRAKLQGRGRVQFYAESMGVQAEAALNVRMELARALGGDGFEIAYQPIIRLHDGTTEGYEALLRLKTADGRTLRPPDFLELARSAHLMPTIDRLVLHTVLRDAASGSLPAPAAGVAVNVEAEELRDLGLAGRVLGDLHETGVAPERLTIEVTESALLMFDDDVLANVRSLREAGIRIAIDDFGTGYSSLSQLRNLSADILKIDRAFVSAMGEDPESSHIVSTVIQLAHELGLVAIAEGVETREQAETLLELGCDLAQGYLFGRPEFLKPTPATGQSVAQSSSDSSRPGEAH